MKINVIILSGSSAASTVTPPTRLGSFSLSSKVLCDPTCGSQFFQSLIDEEDEDKRDDETHEAEAVVYEENVPLESFRHFVEFQQKYIHDPISDVRESIKNDSSPNWTSEFFKSMRPRAVVDLALLANYLDCALIKDVCLLRLLALLANIPLDQVEDAFELPERMRLSPEEKKKLFDSLQTKYIPLSD